MVQLSCCSDGLYGVQDVLQRERRACCWCVLRERALEPRSCDSESVQSIGADFLYPTVSLHHYNIHLQLCPPFFPLGLSQGHRPLIRLFAIGTAIDLICTLILLLILLLLTYAPTLSQPFSTFLCNSTTSTSASNAEAVWWTLEACEAHWRQGMGVVVLGAMVAIGLRGWGTAITWQHYGAISRLRGCVRGRGVRLMENGQGEGEGEDWFDTEMMIKEEEANRRRMREMRDASARVRSSTLPLLFGGSQPRPLPRHMGRPKSHTIGGTASRNDHRAQLVLVPVFVDDQPPPPPRHSRSSSSTSAPAYTSPTRSSSSSSSSGCRANPTRSTTSPRITYPSLPPSFTAEPESFPFSSPSSSTTSTSSRRSQSEDAPPSYRDDDEFGLGLHGVEGGHLRAA